MSLPLGYHTTSLPIISPNNFQVHLINHHGNLKVNPQRQPPQKGSLMVVDKPLIRPYFLGKWPYSLGAALGGSLRFPMKSILRWHPESKPSSSALLALAFKTCWISGPVPALAAKPAASKSSIRNKCKVGRGARLSLHGNLKCFWFLEIWWSQVLADVILGEKQHNL